MDYDDYIPISALNQYDYCPHRCYLIHIERAFTHNEHTIAGTLEHTRADSGESGRRGELSQFRSVRLYSRKYGLSGKADLIEETSQSDGGRTLYPVEHKHGRRGDWKNDQLQLCAQALCLEEMLELDEPIRFGYIYYVQTARRKDVALDEELRRYTIETIERVHRLMSTGERPLAVYTERCRGCSLYQVCLPRETERLKAYRQD